MKAKNTDHAAYINEEQKSKRKSLTKTEKKLKKGLNIHPIILTTYHLIINISDINHGYDCGTF